MVEFPKSTKVDKFIPKTQFYNNAKLDTRIKNAFQNDVERITWAFKLGPTTLPISAKNWPEIEVIRVEVKHSNYNPEILKKIDQAIPYPILFIIAKGDMEKLAISYKEPNKRNENTAKVDRLFETDWNDPLISDIKIDGRVTDVIYANFLGQVAGEKLNFGDSNELETKTTLEGVKDDVDKMKEREKIQRQIDAIDRKIKAEPSIGKKQELAEERYKLKKLL